MAFLALLSRHFCFFALFIFSIFLAEHSCQAEPLLFHSVSSELQTIARGELKNAVRYFHDQKVRGLVDVSYEVSFSEQSELHPPYFFTEPCYFYGPPLPTAQFGSGFERLAYHRGDNGFYKIVVPSEFVRHIRDRDTLAAYLALILIKGDPLVVAMNSRNSGAFIQSIESAENIEQMKTIARFLVSRGYNPYAYLQLVREVNAYRFPNSVRDPSDFLRVKNSLDQNSQVDIEERKIFSSLPRSILYRNHLESVLKRVANLMPTHPSLIVPEQANPQEEFSFPFRSTKIVIDRSENSSIHTYIEGQGAHNTTFYLKLPGRMDVSFENEDQFVALFLYALFWRDIELQTASTFKKMTDEQKQNVFFTLDQKVVNSLIYIANQATLFESDSSSSGLRQDVSTVAGQYSPNYYFNLLRRINLSEQGDSRSLVEKISNLTHLSERPADSYEKFEFHGFIDYIRTVMEQSRLSYSIRINALQHYLRSIASKNSDLFPRRTPMLAPESLVRQVGQNSKIKRIFSKYFSKTEAQDIRNDEVSRDGMSFLDIFEFATKAQNASKIDSDVSSMIQGLKTSELTEENLKKLFNHGRLTLSSIAAINMAFSSIDEQDPQRKVSLFRLIQKEFFSKLESNLESKSKDESKNISKDATENAKNAVVADYSRAPICSLYEMNHLKMMKVLIDTSDISIENTRSDLIKILKDYRSTLGPCLNDKSGKRIFKLLLDSEKVDLGFILEWDSSGAYRSKFRQILKNKLPQNTEFLRPKSMLRLSSVGRSNAISSIHALSVSALEPSSLRETFSQLAKNRKAIRSRNLPGSQEQKSSEKNQALDDSSEESLGSQGELILDLLAKRAAELYTNENDLVYLHQTLMTYLPLLNLLGSPRTDSENMPIPSEINSRDETLFVKILDAAIRTGKVRPTAGLLRSGQISCGGADQIVEIFTEEKVSQWEIVYWLQQYEKCGPGRIGATDMVTRYLDRHPMRSWDEAFLVMRESVVLRDRANRGQNHFRARCLLTYETIPLILSQISAREFTLDRANEFVKWAVPSIDKELAEQAIDIFYVRVVQSLILDGASEVQISAAHRAWLQGISKCQLSQRNLVRTFARNSSKPTGFKTLRKVLEAAFKASLSQGDDETILNVQLYDKQYSVADSRYMRLNWTLFNFLLDSDLDSQSVQKWIEQTIPAQNREKFYSKLNQRGDERTLDEVAVAIRQLSKAKGTEAKHLWHEVTSILRQIPPKDFGAYQVNDLLQKVKGTEQESNPIVLPIVALASLARVLETSDPHGTDVHVFVYENASKLLKEFPRLEVDEHFYQVMRDRFMLLASAVLEKNPTVLVEGFDPSTLFYFSKHSVSYPWNTGLRSIDWSKKIFQWMVKQDASNGIVFRWLSRDARLDLLKSYFEKGLIRVQTWSELKGLFAEISSLAIPSFQTDRMSGLEKKEFQTQLFFYLVRSLPSSEWTWEKVYQELDLRTLVTPTVRVIVPLIRLLHETNDIKTLADIHELFSKFVTSEMLRYQSESGSRSQSQSESLIAFHLGSKELCEMLDDSFFKMIEGSYRFNSANQKLVNFTPVNFGCGKKSDYYLKKMAKIASNEVSIRSENMLATTYLSKSKLLKEQSLNAVIHKENGIQTFEHLKNLIDRTLAIEPQFVFKMDIFKSILNKFRDSEFTSANIDKIFPYLVDSDKNSILRLLEAKSKNSIDLDYIIQKRSEGPSLMWPLEVVNLEKLIMESVKARPENLIQFPIQMGAERYYFGRSLANDWYSNGLICTLIQKWTHSPEYLLSWIKYLPPDFDKRKLALLELIRHSKVRSLKEWSDLLHRASSIRAGWMNGILAAPREDDILFNLDELSEILAQLPKEEATGERILAFLMQSGEHVNVSDGLYLAMMRTTNPSTLSQIHHAMVEVRKYLNFIGGHLQAISTGKEAVQPLSMIQGGKRVTVEQPRILSVSDLIQELRAMLVRDGSVFEWMLPAIERNSTGYRRVFAHFSHSKSSAVTLAQICELPTFESAYIKMIRSAMDEAPQDMMDFFDVPLKSRSCFNDRSFQSITSQEDKVKIETYNELARHLVASSSHWPPGMAWAWIDEHLPKPPENKSEKWKLKRGYLIDPVAAIVDIGAKRGVLSFKQIPTEIEAAKGYFPDFKLNAKTQQAILEKLDKNTFTFENLSSYAEIDDVWIRQTSKSAFVEDFINSVEKNALEIELEKRVDRPDLVEHYRASKKVLEENPMLIYDLENSEVMQKLFIKKMKEGKAWPSDESDESFKKRHQILLSLARRGPSEFTDDLLFSLYNNPKFNLEHLILETVKQRAFWNLDQRKILFEKFLKRKNLDSQSIQEFSRFADYTPYLVDIVAYLNMFIPEPSLQRSDILEKLSNDMKSNQKLAEMIQSEKVRVKTDYAKVALSQVGRLMTRYKTPEDRMDLVKFLAKGIELPPRIAGEIRQWIGTNRLRQMFVQLPPYPKAMVMNALIVENLLPNPKYKKELEGIIWENVGDEYVDVARIFFQALHKAIQEVAPYDESPFVAFLLGQLAKFQGSVNGVNQSDEIHPGEKLKYLLESLGGIGVSIGQKIYQRRMLPSDYLEHLKDMTDYSPIPPRKEIFDRISKLIGRDRIDSILTIEEVLGSASTAVVVKAKLNHKNYAERALKMTFEDLKQRTQLESLKMKKALGYLIELGGSKYHSLDPVVQEVINGLKNQENLLAEQNNTEMMKYLYETPVDVGSQVQALLTRQSTDLRQNSSRNSLDAAQAARFKVIQSDPDAGKNEDGDEIFRSQSTEHVFLDFAKGKTLGRLTVEQKKIEFPKVFYKEMSILLADRPGQETIYFEKDRHTGNYIVNFEKSPIEISVFDYLLLTHISKKDRQSLLQLMGWISSRMDLEKSKKLGKMVENKLKRNYVDQRIAQLILDEITTQPLIRIESNLLHFDQVKVEVTEILNRKHSSLTELIFSIFSKIDEMGAPIGISVKPELVPYIVALGHTERYSEYIESKSEDGAFLEYVKPYVMNAMPQDVIDKVISATDRQALERLQEQLAVPSPGQLPPDASFAPGQAPLLGPQSRFQPFSSSEAEPRVYPQIQEFPEAPPQVNRYVHPRIYPQPQVVMPSQTVVQAQAVVQSSQDVVQSRAVVQPQAQTEFRSQGVVQPQAVVQSRAVVQPQIYPQTLVNPSERLFVNPQVQSQTDSQTYPQPQQWPNAQPQQYSRPSAEAIRPDQEYTGPWAPASNPNWRSVGLASEENQRSSGSQHLDSTPLYY